MKKVFVFLFSIVLFSCSQEDSIDSNFDEKGMSFIYDGVLYVTKYTESDDGISFRDKEVGNVFNTIQDLPELVHV